MTRPTRSPAPGDRPADPARRAALRCGLGGAALLAGLPAPLRAVRQAAASVAHLAGSDDRPYLQAALDAARWVRAAAVETPTGLAWPADPLRPAVRPTDLYSGSAGVVLFLLALHEATGERTWLEPALAGADHLVASLPAADAPADRLGEAGLYTGHAGLGVVLAHAARLGGQDRHREGARRAVALLARQARAAGAGVSWNPSTDIISGSSGIGLALLHLHRAAGDGPALDLAVRAGRRLVELAQPVAAGRRRWEMSPGFAREMPNFSHGTAGVAYFLATLHEAAPEPAFREAALDGARYLQSIATATPGDGRLIYHNHPDGRDLYYLGWCHGPVGTARLWQRLARVTGDAEWTTWVRRSAQGLLASGVPEQRTPGFWNNVSQCCGNAGVGDFFLSLHAETRDAAYLAFARRVAADTLRRGSRDAAGLRWVQAEHRVRPELLVAQTGLMQGAAGVGLGLLRLDAAERGRRRLTLVLPDSPFIA